MSSTAGLDLMQEIRFAIRSLLRMPALTLTIVLTVGLGIGATTVMFAAVDAAILRPLPYTSSHELVRIYTDSPPYRFRFSLVDFLALEAEQTHFSGVAAYTDRSVAFTDGRTADRLRGRLVSWNYFDLLEIHPVLGRRFSRDDGRTGAPPAVIVSHALWQERLGAQEDVIGSSIRLDGTDHTVVGVLPRRTGPFEHHQDLFVAAQWTRPPRKGPFPYIVIGRLPEGANRQAAADELRAINKRLFPIWQASYQDERATWSFMDLRRYVIGDSRPIAALSLAVVALVWLLACANASNLMIARVTGRRRELAVRAALGASRLRVLQHLFTESLLLTTASIVLGLVVASLGAGIVQAVGADYLPRTEEITLEGRTLIVLLGLGAVSVLLFGLIPALVGTDRTPDDALRAGRTATATKGARRIRDLLVASEFALATPLLTVAALLLLSLGMLQRVDLGFETRGVLTGSIQMPAARYRDAGRIEATWTQIQQSLAPLPGVSAVAFADGRPPEDVGNFNNFELETHPTPPGQSQPVTPWVAVTPEYADVFGLQLLEGRWFDDRDRQNPDAVVVVDRAWARRFFPDGSAVGKRLRGGGCATCPWTTVVGVVNEVKYAGLTEPDQGTVYTPLVGSTFRNVVLRTPGDPARLIPSLRAVIRQVDPELPVSSVLTGEELVETSLAGPRSLSALIASLAVVAVVLATIGIYGVMAYHVQQQSREMSIRLALGGTPGRVLRLVIGRGMRVVGSGVAVGLLCGFAASRGVASLLFAIGADDARAFAAAGVLLLAVALLACAVPGRHAMRLEPAAVLREE